MAEVAYKLKMSPSLLSHISNGRRSIPKNLYYALVMEYRLSDTEARKLSDAIRDTEIYEYKHPRNLVRYVVCRTIDEQPFTKQIMKLFASCVNKLTEEEAAHYIKQFQKISERQNKN